jgi:DNA-binding helix-hairpin-helix protein with protein kinase domain
VQWLLQFWKNVFEATTTSSTMMVHHPPLAPSSKKRPRTTYQYNHRQQQQQQLNTLDDLMKGSYKLPTAILCILISLELCDTWDEVTQQAYGLQKAWKTLTSEEIRAALTVVGLECCLGKGAVPHQEVGKVKGLTSMLMLEYLTRSG